MPSVIARTAIAPVLAQPTLRAEQVTQLVLGETATVLESSGEWRRVAVDYDRYEGWVHAGYLVEAADTAADAWRRDATGWSNGIVARLHGSDLRVPLRARLVFANGDRRVRLPDGREASVVSGTVDDMTQVAGDASAQPPEVWAFERFAGAPYLWGGVTPWGVDCSGLVQTTFVARGMPLPRDASQQAQCGVAVPLHDLRPGDLLFFRSEDGPEITHVAFAGPDDTLVHSTVACGGVLIEPRLGGERVQALHRRLVAVRRIERRA
jgi:hypothetical protein